MGAVNYTKSNMDYVNTYILDSRMVEDTFMDEILERYHINTKYGSITDEYKKDEYIYDEADHMFNDFLEENIIDDIMKFNEMFKRDILELVQSTVDDDFSDVAYEIKDCLDITIKDGYYDGISVFIEETYPKYLLVPYGIKDVISHYESSFTDSNMSEEMQSLVLLKVKELVQEYDYMLGNYMKQYGSEILLKNGYVIETSDIKLDDPNLFNQNLDKEKLNEKMRNIISLEDVKSENETFELMK